MSAHYSYASNRASYLGPGGRDILIDTYDEYATNEMMMHVSPVPSSRSNRHSCSSSSSSENHNSRHQPRTQRPPRPSYTQDQKFFIMYFRIVQGYQWTAIKNYFERYFDRDGQHAVRTEEGLTSVYYRVRNEWGLQPVQSGPASDYDRSVVHSRAQLHSPEFLSEIGYHY